MTKYSNKLLFYLEIRMKTGIICNLNTEPTLAQSWFYNYGPSVEAVFLWLLLS